MARKTDIRRKSAQEQQAIRKAKAHFGIKPKSGIYLKHIDETLSYTNPARYHEWRIEDLTTMTKAEWYANYHNSQNWRKRISVHTKPYKWYSKGSSTEKLKTAEFPWKKERRNLDTTHNTFAKKKVICVESGIIYSTITAAAKAVGIASSGISSTLYGKQKTAGGFHWIFA